ncbi:MAG: HDIG domain-containing protein [bacterium]|nr:HDIG domain-containing protein [bacterium]
MARRKRGSVKRDEAVELVEKHIENKNLRKHMYAVEACMVALAERLEGDKELWMLAGLLHDLDYEQTAEDPDNHGKITVGMLKEYGDFPQELHDAVLAHAGHKKPEGDFETSLYAIDPTTGLIVAAALMHPEKKLPALDVRFIMRRFKEKRFAAGADREQIKACAKLGLELEEFLEICLSAMESISVELGL